MFTANGILFNHESERRDKLYLGNLNALRDWGYAKDYIECIWLILQQEKPDDYVIATGECHTVREFCTLAFRYVSIELRWEGEGVNEKGIDVKTGKVLVEQTLHCWRLWQASVLFCHTTTSSIKQYSVITQYIIKTKKKSQIC